MRHIFTRLRVRQNVLNLEILKYVHRELFTPTHHTLGGWHVLKISLKQLVRFTIYAFEELSIPITQVQACLNSYRLTVLYSDFNDLTYCILQSRELPNRRTSSKKVFLSLTSVSYPLVMCLGGSTCHGANNFYGKRWSTDYLNNLQQRGK